MYLICFFPQTWIPYSWLMASPECPCKFTIFTMCLTAISINQSISIRCLSSIGDLDILHISITDYFKSLFLHSTSFLVVFFPASFTLDPSGGPKMFQFPSAHYMAQKRCRVFAYSIMSDQVVSTSCNTFSFDFFAVQKINSILFRPHLSCL